MFQFFLTGRAGGGGGGGIGFSGNHYIIMIEKCFSLKIEINFLWTYDYVFHVNSIKLIYGLKSLFKMW